MTDYEKSKEAAEAIGNVLSQGKELTKDVAQSSVNNLMRSSLNSILSLVSKQDAQIREKCLNEGNQVDNEYNQQLEATTRLVRQVELACYKQDLRDNGKQVDLQKPLLTELYDYTLDEYNESKIKINDARAVIDFNAETMPTDLKAEEFLSQILTTGRQAKLNELGLRTLLMSKLVGSAKQIVISHLHLHNLKIDNLPFKDLVALCEHNFCPNSHPRQANLQLQSLPKLAAGDNSFLKLMSTVTRLAKISTLEVDQEHRDILFQSRALDAFLNCLQPKHKSLIVTENHKRHQQGLAQFTLAGATEFLVQGVNQMETEMQANILYNSTINRASYEVGQYEDNGEDNQIYDEENYAFFVPRGRSRGKPRSGFSRATRRPWAPRGSPGNRGQDEQGFNRERGSYQRGFSQDRGNYSNRRPFTRGNFTRGERFNDRSNFRGSFPARGGYEKKASLNHSYGIARQGCYLCGLPHSYLDASCIYFGLQLQKTPCKKCSTGLHPTSKCLGNIQQAQEAFKKELANDKAGNSNTFRGRGRGRMVYENDEEIDSELRNDLHAFLEEVDEAEN